MQNQLINYSLMMISISKRERSAKQMPNNLHYTLSQRDFGFHLSPKPTPCLKIGKVTQPLGGYWSFDQSFSNIKNH